jgi:hypothetical protein
MPTKILTKSSSHNSHWFWWSWQNALLNQAPGPRPIGPLFHSNIIPPSFLSQNRPFPPLAPEFKKNAQSKQISIFYHKLRCPMPIKKKINCSSYWSWGFTSLSSLLLLRCIISFLHPSFSQNPPFNQARGQWMFTIFSFGKYCQQKRKNLHFPSQPLI